MNPLRIAVLVGGPSSEANVSRSSGRAVADALRAAGQQVRLVELGADTALLLHSEPTDVAFPVTHGPIGEDGCLQGMLEVLGLPYVGSAVLASALAADKPCAKRLFRAAGLPLAQERLVSDGADLEQCATRIRGEIGPAVVVKPANGGSAIGTTRVAASDPDAAMVVALRAALAVDARALVEAFASGQEVTCGVLELDDAGARALPPTLIESKAAEWYDFESRYAVGGSVHHCPAPLPAGLTQQIQSVALEAHATLGCRDLSRVDFVVDAVARRITLLEVNTLPGMTSTSLFPEAAAAAGVDFAALCLGLARRAYARVRRSVPDALPMPTAP